MKQLKDIVKNLDTNELEKYRLYQDLFDLFDVGKWRNFSDNVIPEEGELVEVIYDDYTALECEWRNKKDQENLNSSDSLKIAIKWRYVKGLELVRTNEKYN